MNYRILRVELNGKISEVLIVDAADDRAALARAQSFAHYQAVEVWCGTRQLAVPKLTGPRRMRAAELCA